MDPDGSLQLRVAETRANPDGSILDLSVSLQPTRGWPSRSMAPCWPRATGHPSPSGAGWVAQCSRSGKPKTRFNQI